MNGPLDAQGLTALLPFMAAGAVPVALILGIAVRRSESLAFPIALGGFALTLAALIPAARVAPVQATPLLVVDPLALYFIALAVLAGAATVLFGRSASASSAAGPHPAGPGETLRPSRPWDGEEREELYVLIALAVLGAAVLGASRHFAALFLGLELLSVSLFPLIAYERRGNLALEAGIKYLVLSSVASGLLLFGIALLYAGLGSLELSALGRALAEPEGVTDIWTLGGIALTLAGLAMKLSLVPLHWWTPDVYQGAPAAVTGFLASVSKGAVAVVLLRLLVESGAHREPQVMALIAGLAILSMLVGNLLALLQESVRRILAYSSIAHMGYLLVAFLVAGDLAVEAVCFYLAAYFVTTLGAFGALALHPGADSLAELRGLYGRRPWLTASFTLMLLSLAGIPLTAGFVGKFYLFAVGVDAALWIPVAVLALTSAIGLFYYLRIVFALYSPGERAPAAAPAPGWSGAGALATLTIVLIWLGAWPDPFIGLVRSAVNGGF